MKNGMENGWQIGWMLKNTYYKEGSEEIRFEFCNESFIGKRIIKQTRRLYHNVNRK